MRSPPPPLLPRLGGAVGGRVEGGESPQRVSRHCRSLPDDLLHEGQGLIPPNLGRVVLDGLVGQAEPQHVDGEDVMVPGQVGDVPPPVVGRGAEAVDEEEGGIGRVSHLQVVDLVPGVLPRLVPVLHPWQGVLLEVVEVGQGVGGGSGGCGRGRGSGAEGAAATAGREGGEGRPPERGARPREERGGGGGGGGGQSGCERSH